MPLHAVLRATEVLLWWVDAFDKVRVEAILHEVGVELVVELLVARMAIPVRLLSAVVEIWTWSKAARGTQKRKKR